jgi:hypothetical protein
MSPTVPPTTTATGLSQPFSDTPAVWSEVGVSRGRQWRSVDLPLSTGQNLESISAYYRALLDGMRYELLQLALALQAADAADDELAFRGRPVSRREVRIAVQYRGKGKPTISFDAAADED